MERPQGLHENKLYVNSFYVWVFILKQYIDMLNILSPTKKITYPFFCEKENFLVGDNRFNRRFFVVQAQYDFFI